MSRTRTLTAGLAVAALLLTAVPAGAATEIFAAESSSAGVTVSLAGNEVLEAAGTYAAVVPGEALAIAIPAAVAGTPIGDREAASDGDAVFDPEDDADRCLAAVPPPLDAVLGARVACGDAYAEGGVPAAAATAGVGQLNLLDLDAEDLDAVLDLIATLPLDELLAAVEEELLAELLVAFEDVRAECVDALTALGSVLLDDLIAALADASPDEIADILAPLGGILETLDAELPTACDVLLDLAELLVDGDLIGSITDGDILDALAGAEGVLSITLIETASDAVRDGDDVLADAGPADGGAIAIVVDIPLLDELIADLLADVLGPVVEAIGELLEPVAAIVEDIPELGPILADLLTSGSLGALLEGPLLAIGIAPGEAFAEGDLSTGETDGESSPSLVELGGTLFELPILAGLDDAINELAATLDSTLLAALRDSPLADIVAIELLPGSVEDAEIGELAGTLATSGTASVEVLGALADAADGPLLAVDVAPAMAGVGLGVIDTTDPVTPPPVVPPGPDPVTPTPAPAPLPVTGGGAALLGLAALGAAAALRRRD
ncbi:hypothetical protein [Nitriliruptor alkaliphilus]|uniref:hypothetical protein n=1 Tax=Nitriliruptor alkaliphilus TaxID=427918 RepID=UPI000696008B|nr:hypothetical protein [Nitriliruptor alkaliphilus]